MKVICIIPARFQSSRFPGKPLALICGEPMIWWVYKSVCSVKRFSDIVVAIDDERIKRVCEEKGINYIMTRNNHPNHISRLKEVSDYLSSDLYVCVNGDEPLISPKCIEQVIPDSIPNGFFIRCAMRKMNDAAEVMDQARIKVVVSSAGRCLYLSRAPIPYPKGTLLYDYNKYVGIECFSKEALDFFVSTPMSQLEHIEDIDHLRFLEHNKPLYFKYVESDSISVDTPKDIEKVSALILKGSRNNNEY